MPFKNNPKFYYVWASMKDRCYNPKNKQFKDYGGRGITVCDDWVRNYKQFESDMGERPEGYSLDRIDNDKGYSPENCKWSSRLDQVLNRRNSINLLIDGKKYRPSVLAKISGLKQDTVIKRAKLGLTYDEVISPIRRVFYGGAKLGAKMSALKRMSKTHCSRGHEFTEKNTRITREGWRNCRACHNLKMRKRNAINRGEIPFLMLE